VISLVAVGAFALAGDASSSQHDGAVDVATSLVTGREQATTVAPGFSSSKRAQDLARSGLAAVLVAAALVGAAWCVAAATTPERRPHGVRVGGRPPGRAPPSQLLP
jgi:hypothetical protein